ncbi:PAS domain S-box protein [Paenibacillus puerhi]|uniref:PAS domain S-box protein n=1 Tax=Paenibacillus puerhi TaxID=2692622 RepID=UPI00135C46EF|nr:PAS domain S-box protein [Paenibacillus puerhi]
MSSKQADTFVIFEHAYTGMPLGAALISAEGSLLKANPAFCTLLGYSPEQRLDLTLQTLIHPDDIDANERLRQQALAGESPQAPFEQRYADKDGKWVRVSVQIQVIKEESAQTPAYFLYFVREASSPATATSNEMDAKGISALLAEHARDIIYACTTEGVCQYISPSVRSLLGYDPQEFVGNTNFAYFHPDDLAELQAKEHSDADVLRFRFLHKNGHFLWFEGNYALVRNEQGEPDIILAIVRDITERKRNEDILSEAQRITSLGSWEWNITNKQLMLSDQMYRIFNLVPGSFSIHEPQKLLYLVHPDDRDRMRECIQRILQGETLSFEIRHLQPDGTIKYLYIQGSLAHDITGKDTKIGGTVQDITERKRIELQLMESVERYTSLKKYNHDGIISLDLKGNIINANGAAEKLIGLKASRMTGSNVSCFFGPDILHHLENDPIQTELSRQLEHVDGHVADVLLTIAPIVIHEKTVGYYIIVKDITEQRKLLIAKEAAESTNRAKSEFLSMMSHEIRTPMNGVIGMADLLTQTTLLNEVQKEYVEIIRKSGNTLLTIINDILDFSKIESGNTSLRQETLELYEIIEETLDLLSQAAHKKKLTVSYAVDPDVPASLIGDTARLKQILINLIGNSIKFTLIGGIQLTVQLKERQEDRVLLQMSVKDTGIGIPQSQAEQIFDPFYQLDHFMTRKSEGTGLGLAITKKLVELMDGRIWVEQKEEPGTTITFTIWLQENRKSLLHEEGSCHKKTAGSSNSLSLLVAEDNEINQLVLKKMLEAMGHQVSIAQNGSEAVEAVQRNHYDIVFMDLQMPQMSGLEAAEKIKQFLPHDKCPFIVAVTANALNGERERCIAAGMDDYIAKPTKLETVSAIIQKFSKQTQTLYHP